jgi:hypothetical protein
MSNGKNLYKTLFETQENKLKTGIVGMIIITSMLATVFYFEAQGTEVVNLDELQDIVTSGDDGSSFIEYIALSLSENGYTAENQDYEIGFEISTDHKRLKFVNCTLTWTDEGSGYFRGTNDPDEFQVTIIAPNNNEASSGFSYNSPGGQGLVQASFELDYKEDGFKDNYLGTWTIKISAGDCGDDSALVPIFGIRTTPDVGNEWTLMYDYTYMDKEK